MSAQQSALEPESPAEMQRTIDELRVEQSMQNDDETPMQRFWRDTYRIAAVLDPKAQARDISDTANSGSGKNKHRHIDNSDRVIYVMSLTNSDRRTTAGLVSKCGPRVAAECLVKGTHRLANDAQIAAHDAEHKARFDEAKRLRQREQTAAEQIAGALTQALRPDQFRDKKSA